ncbi:hypothetical protein N431DRAFT_350976 [Stipitochalara longipes BDJ]|nr:hypothetical protein N431DRAFT_350976 [Stipitochalara longipes BDJ]
MAEQQSTTLPNELWIRVLQNLDNDENIAGLWTTCRHVCTAFKDATEAVFRDRHLPKTRLHFRLGKLTESRIGRQLPDFTLMAEFEFADLSEDGCTATFRLNDDIPEEMIPPVKERMQTFIENMDIANPNHSIQIRRDVLDGPIPSLSYEKNTCELSCNWRDLFTAFYGEEALARRLTDQWLDSKVAYLEELKKKLARGEMGAERIISTAILEIGSGEEICRRNARRARIRHQFRELDGKNWDPEQDGDSAKECDALNELRTLKQFAESEAFSDEEDSDEWEDEDEDGDEEDEEDEDESMDDEL